MPSPPSALLIGLFIGTLLMVPPAFPNQLPIGNFEAATSERLQGWAKDPDYAGPIDVHVYIEYNGTGPIQLLTIGKADRYRQDVGFHAFDIPYGALGSNHRVHILAINVDQSGSIVGSGNSALTASPKSITNSPVATTTGVYAFDMNLSPPCPNQPTKMDLWLLVNGAWEFHNRCYANTGSDSTRPYAVFCAFKYPVPTGTDRYTVLLRSWKMNGTCTEYMDQIDPGPSSYLNHFPATNVLNDSGFRGYGRSVYIDRPDYQISIDRHGGAVYEFYSKAGTDNTLSSGRFENAVHAHLGAALQVAIHTPEILSETACNGVGKLNPNQSGASCTHPTGTPTSPRPATDLNVYCDGALNNGCTSATNVVKHTLHRMMNWDYGPAYPGPYGSRDLSHLKQVVTAFTSYVRFDISLVNVDATTLYKVEIPTFYFVNRYRRMHYPESTGQIVALDIPLNLTGNDENNFVQDFFHDLAWVTVENTSLGVSDYFVTVGWLYKEPFLQDVREWHARIREGSFWDNIKFTNVPRFDYRTDVVYKFRYVLFPYKYDEVVTTEFGTMTVKDTLAAMRIEYLASP